MILKKGTVLDNRYVIIDKIGAGGMAIVYKAQCKRLNRIVAIKVLREELLEDENFVEKFKAEAQQVASLVHPNIVNIYDVGQDGDTHYIAMEYIEGRTLKEIIQKVDQIEEKVALTIVYSIISALLSAHKNDIIHRDLKSKNIMINEDGIVKVADFGIAKATSSSTISMTTNAIGSVHYFSPEQAKGEAIDVRSDIYSLGIIMYEMFTKTLPFDGENPVNVALKHVTETVPKPSLINKTINPAVERIIIKATRREKENRYQTVLELEKEVETFLEINKKRSISDNEIFKKLTPVAPVEEPKQTDLEYISNEMAKKTNRERKMSYSRDEERSAENDTKLIVSAIITSLMIIGILLFGMLKYMNYMNEKIVTRIPNLIGIEYITAKENEKALGITLNLIGEEFNEDHEKGIIIDQDIEPNTTVNKGSAILGIIVSRGSTDIKISDVSGLTLEEAKTQLENEGFTIEAISENSETIEIGKVIHTVPAAGEALRLGEQITVYVSVGNVEESSAKVPNLYGLSEQLATQKLEEVGLKLGKVTSKVSEAATDGTIIEQSPQKDVNAKKNSTVNIVLAKKPDAPAQTATNENKDTDIRLITVNINPVFALTKDSYHVQIIIQTESSVRPVYDKMHDKKDFPFTKKVEVKKGSMIAVYIDDKLQSEDYVE